MTDEHKTNAAGDDVAEAVVGRRRSISVVWLLPLLAAAVALWLLYKTVSEAALEVTVEFRTGQGITPKKTPVIYQGITIGTVSAMTLNDDLRSVTVTIELERQVERLLKEETDFWLVQPKISLAGVSGLDTLVSGNYITLQPGGGEPARHFVALSEAPPSPAGAPGLQVVLEARELGSVSIGGPVLYQKIPVGEIEGHELQRDKTLITARIEPKYTHLVRSNSRFWNASGIRFRGGLQGFTLETDSLASLVAGGITFDTPADDSGEPVESGTRFRLYENREAAEDRLTVSVHFADPEGLVPQQTAIRFRGVKVGTLEQIDFSEDDPNRGVIARARLDNAIRPYVNENTRFWVVRPQLTAEGLSGLGTLLSGPYVAMSVDGKTGGTPPQRFEAQAESPQKVITAEGLRVTVLAEDAGSIAPGARVLYRKLPVGQVETVQLKGDRIEIGLFIRQSYAGYVKRDSQFWNASGVELSGGLGGVELRTESLASMISGGIAFRTPADSRAKPAREGDRFQLHPDLDGARRSAGLEIAIRLPSGAGIERGTAIRHRGVTVGEVVEVSLAEAMDGVLARARLRPEAKHLAREGSQFWVVGPELGLAGTRNLDTLIRGRYIDLRPGDGPVTTEFTALQSPPQIDRPSTGLNLVLTTDRRGSLTKGIKVFYRDVPVGRVTGYELAPDADRVFVHVNIEAAYAPLVHDRSRFWKASGIAVDAGLFRGVTVRSQPLEALLEGGIAFATPDNEGMGAAAGEGSRFNLHDEPKEEWLQWRPRLDLESP